MKTLTLVRHAKSSWKFAELGDFDRPLNGRGKRDAPVMAERLAAKGVRPDVILASPAKRAAKTAAVIAEAIEFQKGAITWDDRLYGADVSGLAEILWGIDESCTHAMMFGHNPGFTDLSNWLTRNFIDNIPTCGVAIIQLNVDHWKDVGSGSGEIMEFDFPKRVAE